MFDIAFKCQKSERATGRTTHNVWAIFSTQIAWWLEVFRCALSDKDLGRGLRPVISVCGVCVLRLDFQEESSDSRHNKAAQHSQVHHNKARQLNKNHLLQSHKQGPARTPFPNSKPQSSTQTLPHTRNHIKSEPFCAAACLHIQLETRTHTHKPGVF